MIHLQTLGSVPLAGQPKRLALLAYLALARPRGAHRRDTLLALLWPESSAEHGRAALRQALHGLRRELGSDALISTGTEAVSLSTSHIACDAWDLCDAAAAGDHETVLSLYRGDLLAGLFVSDAPAFEHWLDAERAQLRDLVRQSAWAAADAAVTRGSATRVIERTRLAIELSTFDEGAIRHGMQLLASVGERAQAIALYERFAAETRAELETEPSADTQALVASLRRESVVSALPTVAPGPVDVVGAPGVSLAVVLPPVRRRRTFGTIAAVITIAVAATAASGIAASFSGPTMDPRRIRVESFETPNTSPELGAIATVATNRVRDALLSVGDAHLAAPGSDDRAGTTVRATLRRDGKWLTLRGEVVDRIASTVVRSVTLTGTNADSMSHVFSDRLNAAVATAIYPGWGTALSRPVSYAGYRAFVNGLQSIKHEQHDSAVAAFRRAFKDSSFTAAGLLAASELFHMRRFSAAESLVTAMAGRRGDLPPLDARLLEWMERSLRGDLVGAREAIRAVTALAPQADLAWLELAIEELHTQRPHEALAALGHIDRDTAFANDWPSYWATYAEALHIAGDHARELSTIRDGLQRHPEMRLLVNYEVRALAALGRLRELDARLREVPPASPGGIDPAVTMRQVALELSAHGQSAAARTLLGRVQREFERSPPAHGESAAILDFRLGRARTAYLVDDRVTARAIYDSVLHEHPRCLDCVGVLAVLSAREGDREAALAAAARLTASKAPYLFGRQYLWQARVLSVLGDSIGMARAFSAAYQAGTGVEVMTHTDPDLRRSSVMQ